MDPSLELEDIRPARASLGNRVLTTPVLQVEGAQMVDAFGPGTRPVLKLELFQHTGSFKARAALLNVSALTEEQRSRGICAISGGNHAIAVAYAARELGTHARIVMAASANRLRIARCRELGAEVELTATIHDGFRRVEEISRDEGRSLIHPFEGLRTALGTATLGLEFMEQAGKLDAMVVPIGGGGLCAGVSAAVKLLDPACRVYGVEPEGADSPLELLDGPPEGALSEPSTPESSWMTC